MEFIKKHNIKAGDKVDIVDDMMKAVLRVVAREA